MSFAERTVWAEFLSTLAVIAVFAWLIAARHAAGAFAGPDWAMAWARQVLWMIGLGIAVAIAVSVLFAILWRVVTGEEPDDLVDERDRLISGHGWKVALIVTSAGFVAALGALALGAGPFAALNGMLASFALGDLAGNCARLLRYRASR